MDKSEFIKLIIKKKSLDKDIFKLSLTVEDFPIARQILNKIDGNFYTNTILESNNIVEIQSARGKLITNLLNSLEDSLLKSEIKKFIDQLVDEKIFSSSLNKNKKKKMISELNDPWGEAVKEENENKKMISELKRLREERVKRENESIENNTESSYKNKSNNVPTNKIKQKVNINNKNNDIFITIFNLGKKYLKENNFINALESFTILIDRKYQLEGKENIIYEAMGVCNSALENYKDAVNNYSNAISFKVDSELFYKRGDCFLKLEEFNNAINDFQKAISLNKEKSIYFYSSGLAKYKISNFNKAINDFNNAISLENKAIYHHMKALCYEKLGNFGKAIKSESSALKGSDQNFNYIFYLCRGNFKLTSGDIKGSKKDLEKAIKLSSGRDQDAFNNAIKSYNKILNKEPDSKQLSEELVNTSAKKYSNNESFTEELKRYRKKVNLLFGYLTSLSLIVGGIYFFYHHKKKISLQDNSPIVSLGNEGIKCLYCPHPKHPSISITDTGGRYRGTLVLRIKIKQDGSVGEIKLQRSSGYNFYDKTVIELLKKYQFYPIEKEVFINVEYRFL